MKTYMKYITNNKKNELKASEMRDLSELEKWTGLYAWATILAGSALTLSSVSILLWGTKFTILLTVAAFIFTLIPTAMTIGTYKNYKAKIEEVNKRLEEE